MSTIKSTLKKIIPQNILQRIEQKKIEKFLAEEYKKFLVTGKTPHEVFMKLIETYCVTNGKFNESFNDKIKRINPPVSVPSTLEGVAGSFSSKDFSAVNYELNENGYVRFDKKLSTDLCKKIYDFALNTPATVPPAYDKKVVYNPDKPLAEIYRFDMQDLINHSDFQDLIMDPVLVNIARNYLECEPIFDFPALWWTAAFSKDPSHEAAQLYHFDMDRIKWLKIFFYINDVNPENGPHCYVKGSHKAGNKPMELLKRGYTRIPDSDLKKYYKDQDFVELCGDAGVMFAGDTKCWHKGKHLTKGHRLVMEFEYTSSLFGANYPKLVVRKSSDKFRKFCDDNKTYSSNIHFQ